MENLPEANQMGLEPELRIGRRIIHMLKDEEFYNRLSIEEPQFLNSDYLRANGMIVRETLFDIMKRYGKSPKYRYIFTNVHRLFCSLIQTHPPFTRQVVETTPLGMPEGSVNSIAARMRFRIKPIVTYLPDDWCDPLMQWVNIVLRDELEKVAGGLFIPKVSSAWSWLLRYFRYTSQFSVKKLRVNESYATNEFHLAFVFFTVQLGELLGIPITAPENFETVDDDGSIIRSKPDIPISLNGEPIFFFEVKRMPLSAYLNTDQTLDLENTKLLSILKQVCLYLEQSGCEYAILSDFDVVIVIKIDFDTDEWRNYWEDPSRRDAEDAELALIVDEYNDKMTNESSTEAERHKVKENVRKFRRSLPISVSVSRLEDTGSRSLAAIVLALSFREALHNMTSDRHDTIAGRTRRANNRQDAARANALRSSPIRTTRDKRELSNRVKGLLLRPYNAIENAIFTEASETISKGEYSHAASPDTLKILDGVCDSIINLNALQDDRYNRQVYLIDAAEYVKIFPTASENIKSLPTDSKVILKVFSFSHAYDFFKRDLDYGMDKETPLDIYKDEIACRYFCELRSYESISTYNEKHPRNQIHVPKLYDFGFVSMAKRNKNVVGRLEFLFSGFFIAMSYIESEPDTITEQSIERACRELKILYETIKVGHDDIEERNIIVNQGDMYFIDFSHAAGYSPVETDIEKLKRIGKSLMKPATILHSY